MANSGILNPSKLILKACLLLTAFFSLAIITNAQTVVSNETFPNQFNTSFGSTNNTNGSFTGSTGTWNCSYVGSNGSQAAIAVIQAYYTPRSSYAIKIVNWNTTGKGAASCHAASPTVNLSGYSCSPNLNLTFNLYTYTCNANDPNSFLKVEFSTDGGTNWTAAWSMSSAQIFNTYGAEGYTNISVPISAAYRVSGFKYRFSGYKPANQGNNFYVFVDDAKINAASCATCNGVVTSLYFNKLDGGTDLPITNGSVFTQSQLGSLYNIEAGTSGTVGSVKFIITGPTASTNIENAVPYNAPGGNTPWSGTPGNYSVNVKIYSASDATGSLCDEKTYTFNVTNTCNPDDATAGNGTSFCAPTPTCASGNYSWNQVINNTNGSPSVVRLIAGSTSSYIIPSSSYPAVFSSAVTVTVTEVISYDGYAGRSSVTQTNEKWRLVFKKAGTTVATTPYTNDVPDLKNQAYWKGSLGSAITLPNGTDQIIIEHIDLNSNNGPGSVVPVSVCISYTTTTLGSIGDRVWFDANGDGLQNASETTGLAGVTVKLLNSSNAVIATTTTNSSGNYLFTGLAAGTYKVEFPTTLANSTLSPSKVGTNNAIDSDPVQSTGLTANIVLAAGQNITTVDAGYCPTTMSLGNRVWYDADNNGINNSEDGIPNITVFLYKDDNNDNVADGPAIATLITDADGFYIFENLVPGNYIIGAIMPPGYMSSAIDGGDPDNDINLDDNGQVFPGGNEVRGLAITLIAGTEPTGGGNSNITYDFGMHPDCSCTNSAGNLLTNPGFENGNTGWSVSGGTVTTGTGYIACGNYNGFNNWSSGTSKVWQDVNIAAGATVTFSAFAGTHAPGINCSPKLSLIFLNSSNAVIGQTDVAVTRIVGNYHDQLEYYTITAVAPVGTVKARVQSSITCNTMKLDAFCLTATVPGSIGDRVWNDVNKNGTQDAGELGLAGVTVTLYDNSNNIIASTVTDAFGNYLFSNLPTSAAGTNYQVRFSLVPGYQFSPNTGAVTVTTNSDANVTTGRTGNITLTNAVPAVTYVDAGMYYSIPARLGDFVWNDLNNNGIQETGEPGIAGVTVMLYTSGDVLYRSTITSNNGFYFFNDVAPGSYYVKVTPPVGYKVSPKDIGGNDNIDSDIDPVSFKTGLYTVVNGTNNLTIDAGLNVTSTATASLGDRVWEDLNNNNLQDAGEPGIADVTVQLYNSANTLIATATTDAFGNYIFNGLTPGIYYVKFTTPSGFSLVTADAGADDLDSDVNGANGAGTTATVTLIADQINTTLDAGYRRTTAGASLGDFVWYDLNKNGTQDGGAEVGVPGITVVLYSSSNVVIKTTTTDANGFYLFTGLPATTTYTVGFENIPAGYGFSPNNGAITSATNSDVNPSTGRTGTVTTGAAGSTITYVDAGLIVTPNTFESKSTIGDKVFNDLNNNGIQDAGEPGVAGVIVTLYAADGTTVVATTTTDALGNYLFTNLNAGIYVVGFSGLPTGYVFATKDAGTDDTKDSDANTGTGKTDPFSIGAGEINLTIDAGVRNPTALSSIGNFVWYDVNGNGIQNTGEPGAVGISVALLNASGSVLKTTTTNTQGEYWFTDLAPGTYYVQFGNLPAGYVATTKDAPGFTAANGSDANTTTLRTDAIVLAANTTDPNWDMGIVTTSRATLGDYVWNDLNGNGIQDAGEPGVAGITVTLYDDINTPVAQTVTGANGLYQFSNLLPGTYSVGFSNIPASSTFTLQGVGGAALDSDVNPATGRTATFTLVGGQNKTDIDAGLVTYKAAVGDYVWNDVNRNGIQDAGEQGVPGVTVTLYNSSNMAIASAVTDANGHYFINNISVPAAGASYTIGFTDTPTGFVFTTKNAVGSTADNNSDANTVTGITDAFTLSPGQVRLDIDAGLRLILGSIGDRVWNDINNNGTQDTGETGLAGVVVTLFNNAGTVIASTVTDAYGNYLFSNLPTSAAGTNYQVRFSLVPGYQFSPQNGAVTVTTNSDANITTGRTGNITLTNAVPNVTYVDAGMYYTTPARIGDFVWNDLNKDGIQDSGEPGIAGVTVMLYTSANVLYRSTVTSNTGQYYFNDVAPGSYYIKVAPPIGYVASPKDQGGDDTKDSDIDPVTFNSGTITVVNGTNDLTWDAGLYATPTTGPSASLGDRVWEDLNGNNLQDAGEPGIANVTVQLYKSDNTLVATTTTDAFGNYIFNGLMPGSYYVKFTTPAGFNLVTANAGADDIDSDVDATNGAGTTATYTLIADQVNTTVDAGYRRTVTTLTSLGDFVWYDLNKNGLQDGGAEVGVPGITVVLYNSSNGIVQTTTTDGNGAYLFTGLPAATTYTVGFINIPTGYSFSPQNGAITLTNNSDVNPLTGRTGNVTTGAAGSVIRYVDAGLIIAPNTFPSKSTLGDRVWNDINNNGIQDAGEQGIAGVTVTLYAADGTTVIATTVTDAMGNYIFSNLDAGSYVVGFTNLPSGYVFSPKDQGTNDELDSDVNTGTGKTDPITLLAGEINLSVDAGARNNNTTLASIGNFVWNDLTPNGIQEAGEPGVAGVSVALLNASSTVVATTTTNSYGEYWFTDLAPGTYYVQFGNLPAGYSATAKNATGSTAANNSDANPGTLTTDAIVLAAGVTDPNWDMGIVTTSRATLGDYVWNDLNGNGIQEAGEPGVAGITVTLYDIINTPVAQTVTGANGLYQFSNLLPGTYSVGFSNIPASSTFTIQGVGGAALDSDVNPATGRTATFTLVGGQNKTDIDAGLVTYKAAVGDYVWNDVNRNGIQDAGEQGVPGVTVTLYNSSNIAIASAVTDANGHYFINNVTVAAAGSSFTIGFTDLPTGAQFTTKNALGSTAINNSDANVSTGVTDAFTLLPNQIRTDIDAGIYTPINLSGHVWHDVNGNADEQVNNSGVGLIPAPAGIPPVLRAYLVDFSTQKIVNVAFVNPANNFFSFYNVAPNTNYYIVVSNSLGIIGGTPPNPVTLPSGWIHTGQQLGIPGSPDGFNDGRLIVPVGTTDVINANFGIKLNGGDIVVG